MKRLRRDHPKFDLMRLLDRHARSHGVSIRDHANHAAFLADLGEEFQRNHQNQILIHGLRIEAMFAFVAGALGNCRVIKAEDAGDIYALDVDVRAPDFRMVTGDGHEILVEVKNHRPSDSKGDYVFKRTYLDGLRRYAALLQRELYIAIFWSQWSLWSLVRPDRFEATGDRYKLSLGDAMKWSEMTLLGDYMLGTVPPLTLRFLSDPAKPRHVGQDGRAEFTIGQVEMAAAGEVIEDPLEVAIAWFLLNYGAWPGEPTLPEIVAGDLISVGFEVRPEQLADPAQGFEVIGFMSEMLSRQYNAITAGSGRVDLLIPKRDPDELGVLIPLDFKGQKLHLWRFYVTRAISEPEPGDDPRRTDRN